ncbi:Manganese/iron superoxide dismutase [Naviculisporaceae sp. PSN 640]
MMRPRLRIAPLGRIAGGLTSTPAPMAVPFAQSLQQSRPKHTVPPLKIDITDGINGFLSPGAAEMAWTQYQTLMLEKLDQKTAETNFHNKDIKSIILETAREPQHAAIFNYASMAHNNHFFFDRLSQETVEIPASLEYFLIQSFGSIETLRREMIYTADAMFGPGFVWLVKVNHPGMTTAFKVMTTYLAGTPYSGAHWRRQNIDANTDIGQTSQQGLETGQNYLSNAALGQQRKNPSMDPKLQSRVAPGGIDVHPVLCLSTWEHTWLRDYGVGVGGLGGKLEYAESWWHRINWEKVADSANLPNRKVLGATGAMSA